MKVVVYTIKSNKGGIYYKGNKGVIYYKGNKGGIY